MPTPSNRRPEAECHEAVGHLASAIAVCHTEKCQGGTASSAARNADLTVCHLTSADGFSSIVRAIVCRAAIFTLLRGILEHSWASVSLRIDLKFRFYCDFLSQPGTRSLFPYGLCNCFILLFSNCGWRVFVVQFYHLFLWKNR